jgi:hypothetical protein
MEVSGYAPVFVALSVLKWTIDRRRLRALHSGGREQNFTGNLGHNADLKTMNVRRDPGQLWGCRLVKAQKKSVLQNRAMPGLVTEFQPVWMQHTLCVLRKQRFL